MNTELKAAASLNQEAMVNRFSRSTDRGDDEEDCDVVYIDRLTGREVLRYDGADTQGCSSDTDVMADLGYDINQQIPVSQSKVRVNQYDIDSANFRKEAAAKKEAEFAAGTKFESELEPQGLFSWLGVNDFQFENYAHDEVYKLKPAMLAKGFTHVTFIMGEQDSFGPLSRVMFAVSPQGENMRFVYL